MLRARDSSLELGDLPLYNQDLEEPSPPADWRTLRQRIRESDAVLFVTPEYNRSVPGLLKNAIDIASRPYGQNCFEGKPGAIISVSPGGLGGFGANHHLRQSLVFLNVPTLQQPEAYLADATTLFDSEGNLISDSAQHLLETFVQRFADWIDLIVRR
jgi:chromate reductase, NAD(P)H dehydrogenase (quinone)